MSETESWRSLRDIVRKRFDRYVADGKRDLFAVEDDAHRALSLEGRPLLLLGVGSRVAQPFVQHALAFHDVVGAVDNHRAGTRLGSLDIVTDEAVQTLAATHKNLLAVVCAFGTAQHHFTALAERAALPCLTLPQALRRTGTLTVAEPSDWLRNAHPDSAMAVADHVETAGFFRDHASLATVYAVLLHRLSWNPRWLDGVRRPPAELCVGPDTLTLGNDETIIDAGAYDGDTAEHFRRVTGGRYRAMHCFEPDPRNCDALRARVAGWPGVSAERAGLWSSSGTLCFADHGGQGSHVSETGGIRIEVIALDDRPELAPTLVKMDIEGAELPALQGMRQTLKTFKPKLALSAYHKPEDLYELPRLISAIRDDYQFRLRHYGTGLFDTVLYAF